MARIYGAALPALFEGLDAAEQRKAWRKQLDQYDEDRAQQRKIDAALGQGINLLRPPPVQPQGPLPPNPGQASVPMAPPQGQMPPQGMPPGGPQGMPPQGPTQGMPQFGNMPDVSRGMQPPPMLGAPGGQAPIKPYTAPQAAQPQPQQPPSMPVPPSAPPQRPDLVQLMQGLMAKGLDGRTAFGVAQQLSQVLNPEGKMQLAQALEQDKKIQAEAAQTRAASGSEDTKRRTAQAEGTNASGAARINLMNANAEAARSRAEHNRANILSDSTKDISPETVEYYARQSLAGDSSWQVGLARGKVGQRLISMVKDRIPQLAKENDISPNEASSMKGQRDALNKALTDRTKYVATANQFVSNFKKQADIVEKYLKPGAAGSIPVINKWIQGGRIAAGDPDVTALDTAIRGLAREHQRIVTGVTSNAQLHASAQATADELLNRAQTPDQVRSALKVMLEEAENAITSGNGEVEGIKTQLKGLGSLKTKDGSAEKSSNTYASEADAEAAARAGKIKPGDKITIGGQTGTWR